MGRDKRCLANLNEDVRLHILSYCGLRDAVSLMRTNKPWYSSYKITRVWKPIYDNSFGDFNPQPRSDNSDWLREIKSKIRIYGPNVDQYRYLLGNVKIYWEMDPGVQVAGSHIHETLGIYVDDQLLPFMGYGGPNDVCFCDWIVEVFKPLFKHFDANETYTHSWDFCDEAMPEFVFVKESGPICKLSICDGMCGGKADPDWQNVEFLIEDLRAEYIKFLEELYEELMTKHRHSGQTFWNALGIEMSKDGKYIGDKETKSNGQMIRTSFGMPYQPANNKNNNNNIPMTLDNVPTDRHVIFESSDSDSSDEAKMSRSARRDNKIDKKRSKKKKRKSESDSSSEEKPAKKKHKKEKEKKKK